MFTGRRIMEGTLTRREKVALFLTLWSGGSYVATEPFPAVSSRNAAANSARV